MKPASKRVLASRRFSRLYGVNSDTLRVNKRSPQNESEELSWRQLADRLKELQLSDPNTWIPVKTQEDLSRDLKARFYFLVFYVLSVGSDEAVVAKTMSDLIALDLTPACILAKTSFYCFIKVGSA